MLSAHVSERNADVLRALQKEFGIKTMNGVFAEARRRLGLPYPAEYGQVDYREYVARGEDILPDYVRRMCTEYGIPIGSA